MSNPLSPDDSGPPDASPAVVFARLADVPLEAVDKLIESTQAVYDDLNRVPGHPYWGDLVMHQGAAMRALTEARECLDALRSEATGARNTELGISVATAVVDGRRHYAHTDSEKQKVVDRLLHPEEPTRACHFCVWDRPHESDDIPGPFERIRVVTDPDAQLGVLNFTEELEDGELRSWHTHNPRPLADAPTLRFEKGSALTFPKDSLLAFEQLSAALLEFAHSGERPSAVDWQQARWGE